MKRIRIGIVGAGAVTEWAVLPALTGPDVVGPPDTGAWWGRRPSPGSEIHYQAPARPEVVALADIDSARAERVARSWRIRSVYTDWRAMLREVELDALCCLVPPDVAADIAIMASAAVRWLWIDGPPATGAAAARALSEKIEGRVLAPWCAHPLRQAAAHRAAHRLIERDSIGAVAALALRWGLPFVGGAEQEGGSDDLPPHYAASYAAIDLALHFSGWHRGDSIHVVAAEVAGSTSLWWQQRGGATVTALFSAAENWSAPLPRLEISGTQGRGIVCESGRKLWLHEPREAARFLEPPGLASYISAANVVGVAEDLKEFLAFAAGGERAEDERHRHGPPGSLAEAAQILGFLETARATVSTGELTEWRSSRPSRVEIAHRTEKTVDTLVLPL